MQRDRILKSPKTHSTASRRPSRFGSSLFRIMESTCLTFCSARAEMPADTKQFMSQNYQEFLLKYSWRNLSVSYSQMEAGVDGRKRKTIKVFTAAAAAAAATEAVKHANKIRRHSCFSRTTLVFPGLWSNSAGSGSATYVCAGSVFGENPTVRLFSLASFHQRS
jgi:hypothetical protein